MKGVKEVQNNLLLAVAILLPAFSAVFCYFLKNEKARVSIVLVTAVALFAVAGGFVKAVFDAGEVVKIGMDHNAPIDLGLIIKILDLALLAYIFSIGIRLKKPLILVLVALQLIPTILFEIFGGVKEPETAFVIDRLSLIMILLVSIIGPIITIFATGYMKEHEHHQHLKVSKQPKFFMVLFIFLSAMNALVMTNNIMWMYFFWEVTTVCSFLLISHDGTEIAIKNGIRAIYLNLFGGVGFIAGIIFIYAAKGTLALDEISSIANSSDVTGFFAVGIALLCLAGFTKSAQFPFQSWLLGAMVAPTPVSALLHSSTMVKAGVYLIVRLAPSYGGTVLGKAVATVGAFTFLAGSAIAISQSNAKKVLAYSTIANLGLIVCCAGLGSHMAIGAAILLMVFHAVSKGLLFLCVGTVEHGIGSREIEDMQGLMKKMPFTTVIMVIGMISMLMPPFGVLVTKWLAIEAAVSTPLVLLFIVLGSALTVVFWSKWIGTVLTMSYKSKHQVEKLPASIRFALAIMCAFVFVVSVGISPFYTNFIYPQLETFGISHSFELAGKGAGIVINGASNAAMGGFQSVPYFVLFFIVLALVPTFMKRVKPASIRPPYLCGDNSTDDIRGLEFNGPMDKTENVIVRNFYLTKVFGENKLTLAVNCAAIAIILIMFGVVM